MDSAVWAYGIYVLAALGALGLFVALPRGDQRRSRVPGMLLGIATIAGLIVLTLNRYGGTSGANVGFIILAALSIGGAVRVVTHPKPVYSVLYFVLVALSSATMVLLLGAEFLFVAIIAVYAGAILVTYVFVIMLAQQSDATANEIGAAMDYDHQSREPALAVIARMVLAAIIAGAIGGRAWPVVKPMETSPAGHVAAIGKVLMVDNAIALEVSGVLLLIAMVGAIVLSQKRIVPNEAVRMEARNEPALGESGRRAKPF